MSVCWSLISVVHLWQYQVQQWLRVHCSLLWHSHWSEIRLMSEHQTSLKCDKMDYFVEYRLTCLRTAKIIEKKKFEKRTFNKSPISDREKYVKFDTDNANWKYNTILFQIEFVFQLAPNIICTNNIYLFTRMRNELAHYSQRTHMFTFFIQYSNENYAANYTNCFFSIICFVCE